MTQIKTIFLPYIPHEVYLKTIYIQKSVQSSEGSLTSQFSSLGALLLAVDQQVFHI